MAAPIASRLRWVRDCRVNTESAHAGNLIAETDGAGNGVRAYAYAEGAVLGQIDKETPAPYEQIVDDAQASFTGTWPTSTSISGYYGTNYRTNTKGTGKDKATWTITIPQTGSYQVYARWVASSSHASNAPYSIKHATGTTTVAVSQQTNGGTWRLLGTYTFNAGSATVTLTDKANGTVIADAIRILGTQPNGPTTEVIRYLHTDNLNTPRAATNGQGSKVWSYEGEAFGNTPPSGTVTVNLRYPGQYWDAESSLHYNYHRYYSPQLGRYITSDPIGLAAGPNTFLYARANPFRFTDPDGLVTWEAVQTGGQFFTAGGYHFEMTSQCINGKRVKATVLALGPGAGFGIQASATRESATFEDSLSSPDASVFDGLFLYVGAGFSIPPKQSTQLGMTLAGAKKQAHGANASAVRLGDARSLDAGLVSGLDFSIGFLVGSSTVLDNRTEDCSCSLK